MLGYPVIGIWYWCADQTIVQRVLGAKDENHARVGPLFAACIKILPVFIFVLPGLLAYTLASKGLFDISSLPVDSDGDVDTKNIYTLMITQLLPTGLVGLMIAAILAALMSTVSGALNSISTLVSFDLYKRFRPQATDHQLVTVGRIAAAVALAIALGLVPVLRTSDSIFRTLNEIIVHIAPPITCVFLLGVFWKGATAFSAQWTLWVGSAMCVAMILVKKYATLPLDLNNDFMLLSFVLFCSCVMLQVVLAKAGPKVGTAGENVDLTWNSPLEPLRAPGWSGILNYKLITLGILLTMAVLYSVFR
jgi:SSS family solute:Na+ symporter